MRIKSVIDAASGVKRCGASGLNLHHTNAHHPEHRETPQTLFSIHPPTTRRNTAQRTAAYGKYSHRGHKSVHQFTFPPLDSSRNVWYNIAVDNKGKQ